MNKIIFICPKLSMSKFKIINLIDKLFISSAIFLIVYAWINFYTRNLWLTFFLSLIFTFAIVYTLFYFVNKKVTNKKTNKKNEDDIEKNFLAFKLSSKQEKLNILNSIISLNYKTEYDKNNLIFYKENKKTLIILATTYNMIDTKILLNLIDEFYSDNIDSFLIVCESIAPDILKDIFKDKEINFITKKILFNDYFLKNNIFPKTTHLNLTKPKINFKNILNSLFIPQKAKSYFTCGLILIFSSIILPYHYYYIVFGSVLLTFSVICKILPKCRD